MGRCLKYKKHTKRGGSMGYRSDLFTITKRLNTSLPFNQIIQLDVLLPTSRRVRVGDEVKLKWHHHNISTLGKFIVYKQYTKSNGEPISVNLRAWKFNLYRLLYLPHSEEDPTYPFVKAVNPIGVKKYF